MGLEQSMSHFPREECVSASALRACNSGGALRACNSGGALRASAARYARNSAGALRRTACFLPACQGIAKVPGLSRQSSCLA